MPRRTSVIIAAAGILAMLMPIAATAGPRVPTWVTRDARVSTRAVPAAPAAGHGFSIGRDDGNDTNGALDLRSTKITRGGSKDTVVFTNDTAVANTDIDPDNGNFAVLIDTNDDRTFDYGQYVYFYAGKMRGVLLNLSTNRVVDRTAPTARVNTRTFRTVIQRGKVNSPGTYRFAVFTYSEAAPCTRKKACVDAVPNRYPLVPLDHKAPSVTVTNLEAFANDVSGTLTTPLDVTFDDDPFGTGVKSWVVQRKQVGASGGWEQVKKGTSKDPTVNVPGVQGATYQVRVIVTTSRRTRRCRRSSARHSRSTTGTARSGTVGRPARPHRRARSCRRPRPSRPAGRSPSRSRARPTCAWSVDRCRRARRPTYRRRSTGARWRSRPRPTRRRPATG